MPNVNIEKVVHQQLRARAAAQSVPLHMVVNEMLRQQLAPKPKLEHVSPGRRLVPDLKSTSGKNMIWMMVWRDNIDPSVVWRAPIRVVAIHPMSLIARLEGGSAFPITLDGIVDAVAAFPSSGEGTVGDFANAESEARSAYLAWRNAGARAVPAMHRWSDLG